VRIRSNSARLRCVRLRLIGVADLVEFRW
jgi:hypothetical protein